MMETDVVKIAARAKVRALDQKVYYNEIERMIRRSCGKKYKVYANHLEVLYLSGEVAKAAPMGCTRWAIRDAVDKVIEPFAIKKLESRPKFDFKAAKRAKHLKKRLK